MLHKELLQFELRQVKNSIDDIERKLERGVDDRYQQGLYDGMLMTMKNQEQMLVDYIRYMGEDWK